MTINFFNYTCDWIEDYNPKFSIDWFYYNSKPNSKYLEQRNKYRKRTNFETICVDGGSDFSFHFGFGKRRIGFFISIRRAKYVKNPDYQSPSI